MVSKSGQSECWLSSYRENQVSKRQKTLSERKSWWRNIQLLINIHIIISDYRYFAARGESAGRHNDDILDNIIYDFSKERFLAMFPMHRSSFWLISNILEEAGGAGYWDGRVPGKGSRQQRPVYQQVAVTLYMLGAAGGGCHERSGVNLNIGKGTVSLYTWRTIKILVKLLPVYVRWPTARQREEINPPTNVFRHCIGFLDGSGIILRYKPTIDPQSYYSHKGFYGFNLQAICDWNSKFLWVAMGHTASAYDSRAFKFIALYHNIKNSFSQNEYILADKAYALEEHVITPYKGAISREPIHSAFNYALSVPRVKIEHAFGILKARWPSLRDVPIRIGEDVDAGHLKVLYWTISCVVLHNMLASMKDDELWLAELAAQEISRHEPEQPGDRDGERERDRDHNRDNAQTRGTVRRNTLRDLVAIGG